MKESETNRVLREADCILQFSFEPLGNTCATLRWKGCYKLLDLRGKEYLPDAMAAEWLKGEIAALKQSHEAFRPAARTERERMAEFFFGKKV